MFELLTDFLNSFREMGIPGYDCIIFRHGKVVYRHFEGYADLMTEKPITGTELFNLYSCSKVATCTAALQLLEKGLFQLDDPLDEYMPEFRNMTVRTPEGIVPAKKRITVRNLFTMTAGFSYDVHTENLERCRIMTGGKCPTRETMKYLAQDPLSFEPGEKWQYSLCHDVLAAFTEVVSGVEFNRYCRENIFGPLGMKTSTYLFPPERRTEIAAQYRGENGKTAEIPNWNAGYRLGTEYASGGAGVVSGVEDYGKLADALSRPGVILKPETVRLMTTPQLTPEQKQTHSDPGYSYGLGVRCPFPGSYAVSFGWGGAAGALLAAIPSKEAGIFYAQHVLNSPNSKQRKFIIEMALRDL